MKEIAASLETGAFAFGCPIQDRASWKGKMSNEAWLKLVVEAGKLLDKETPQVTDDLYLEYSRNGRREGWQNVQSQLRYKLKTLVLAECLEGNGRFIGDIEKIISGICGQKTWVGPAHDGKLDNFNGKTKNIDLFSSSQGWELAQIDYLLNEKLSPETRKLIRGNVAKRILDPFRSMVSGKSQKDWWLTTTNNWNSVCLAGVLGAALAVTEKPDEKAFFIDAAIGYSENYLAGFTADGYCSEGVGYWNYGFGHYVILAEMIRLSTGGKSDLMKRAKLSNIASYPARIQVAKDVYPAFSDCEVKIRADNSILFYVNRYMGTPLPDGCSFSKVRDPNANGLPFTLMFAFPRSDFLKGGAGLREKRTLSPGLFRGCRYPIMPSWKVRHLCHVGRDERRKQ